MKKKLYLVLVLAPLFAFSQKLEFRYDESGNQIERNLNRSGRVVSENSPTFERVELAEDTTSNQFEVYPSPTQGPVTLRWTEDYRGKVAQIQLSDMAGRKEEIEFKRNETVVEIDLTTKPQGVYIINFYLSEGKRIDKKIIKQN